MISDAVQSVSSMMEIMVTGVTSMVGFFCFFNGIYAIYKYANNPSGNTSISHAIGFIFMGVCMFCAPQFLKSMDDTLFEDSQSVETQTYATPTKPYVTEALAVKKYEAKPSIPKKEYKPVPAQDVDYTKLIVVISSIVGGIISLLLSIVGISKLRTKLRIRRYQKVISEVVELKNDFMTLSGHIDTIDTCLNDIKQYKVTAPVKSKTLLDSMQNILENKKQMFNKAVREIHELQPDLKNMGGVI